MPTTVTHYSPDQRAARRRDHDAGYMDPVCDLKPAGKFAEFTVYATQGGYILTGSGMWLFASDPCDSVIPLPATDDPDAVGSAKALILARWDLVRAEMAAAFGGDDTPLAHDDLQLVEDDELARRIASPESVPGEDVSDDDTQEIPVAAGGAP